VGIGGITVFGDPILRVVRAVPGAGGTGVAGAVAVGVIAIEMNGCTVPAYLDQAIGQVIVVLVRVALAAERLGLFDNPAQLVSGVVDVVDGRATGG